LYQTAGLAAALQTIEDAPSGELAADFLLMKARILDAAGQRAEASQLLTKGMRSSATRPELVQQAALILLRAKRDREALDLVRGSPASTPDLLWIRALALTLTEDSKAAETQLLEIERRWPEWDRTYVLHALLLQLGRRNGEALLKLKTALALGANDPFTKCLLHQLSSGADGLAQCGCVGIRECLLQ